MRYYVHITDLSQGHLLGLEYMHEKKDFSAFNLGNGDRFTVHNVIHAYEYVAGAVISYKVSERRQGDPTELVAENISSKNVLKWTPKYKNIIQIFESSYLWHSGKY